MATYSLAQFQKLSREDLEKSKFWLTADGKIAIRYILWISSRWPPVETWADLPVSGTVEWQAVVVYNDPMLGSTIAVWNGTERKQVWWLIEIPCADVKDCIEAFTELDLSEILNLTLGGDIVFDEWTNIDRTNTTNTGIQNFDNLYIANYDGSTFNYSGDVIMNLAEGDSITYNFDGTVNNDFWVTYIENNIYAEGATITYEWSVIHSYNNYTENTIYEENVIYNYEWAVTNNYTEYIEYNNYDETTNIYYDGGNHYYENSTIIYDEFSSVTYEWDVSITNLTVQNITMEWWDVSVAVATDSANQTPWDGLPTRELPSTPLSDESLHITTDSWTNLIIWVDYTIAGNTITWINEPNTWESIYARWLVWTAITSVITPVEPTTDTVNADFWDYILVTYTTWPTTINLPDASLNSGKQIRIKKFTGEDVLTTTILPFGTQLIDGFTWATMNINRTMYTFTAIDGNWYLGD